MGEATNTKYSCYCPNCGSYIHSNDKPEVKSFKKIHKCIFIKNKQNNHIVRINI